MSRITSFEINAPHAAAPRKVWVYLPGNYAVGEKFPVIYMQDGQNLFYDNLSKSRVSWRVAETMDELYHNRNLAAIVAGVENSELREKEYIPWKAKKKLFGGEGDVNRGEEYAGFLAKILKPYIDKNFKTDASPEANAVAGSELGSLITLFTAMKYNDVFGAAGLFSPAARTDERKFAKFFRETALRRAPSLYIYCGGKEDESDPQESSVETAKLSAKIASERGMPVRLILDSGGFGHESRWGVEFGGFVEYFLERAALRQRENFSGI